MDYPVYVHPRDGTHAHGVTFPDFARCFSAADEIEDLPRLAQEAVAVHFEAAEGEIPAPSSPEDWKNDERFQGGYWMMVDLDLNPHGFIKATNEWVEQNGLPLAQ